MNEEINYILSTNDGRYLFEVYSWPRPVYTETTADAKLFESKDAAIALANRINNYNIKHKDPLRVQVVQRNTTVQWTYIPITSFPGRYGDDITYDRDPETIKGYQIGEDEPRLLELIPGDRYEIHYGIHQGTFIYEGRVAACEANMVNHPHSIGQSMFRNEETGELSFGFYPNVESSLFTRICTKIY